MRDRDRLAEVLVDRARVEVEDVRDHRGLRARVGDRLADVPGLQARELLAVLLEERGEPAEQPRTVGGRDGAPGREGALRRLDGVIRVLGARRRDLGDRLLRRRVQDGDHVFISR
jgi:hypothetical protein